MTAPKQRIHARRSRGFTVLELLTVIAIIGIMAGILIPSAQSARAAANRARTRVQFGQWAAAFEMYKQEYGAYPAFSGSTGAALVNEGAGPDPASSHRFHDVLAGRHRDGSAIADTEPAARQNPRRVRFASFAESDFVRPDDVDGGRNQPGELNLIHDSFHNTSLAIVVDANLDGLIDAADVGGELPSVAGADSDAAIRPEVHSLLGSGIQAGVIFYCAPPGARGEGDLLRSWQ